MTSNLHQLITIKKASKCATCNTYEYMLPVAIDARLAEILSAFSPPIYPLDKFKLYSINTPLIQVKGKLGEKTLWVKYPPQPQYESTSSLFMFKIEEWLTESL